MNCPYFELDYDDQEQKAVNDVLESKWLSSGKKVKEFEDEFAKSHGAKFAISVSNCTAGLILSLIANQDQKNYDVITTPLTFVATANAIRLSGLNPIFCDISSQDDLTISVENIKKVRTQNTKFIIPMHYGGFAPNIESISNYCKHEGLICIEDACHAPLTKVNKKYLGTYGTTGCFSFYANKNIVTGEGGMVLTDCPINNKKIRNLRDHGRDFKNQINSSFNEPQYDVQFAGYNMRMDEIHAALGIVQLKKAKIARSIRSSAREYYINKLNEVDEINIPFRNINESGNHIFPVMVDPLVRDDLAKYLKVNKIGISMHYPPIYSFSVHAQNQRLSQTEIAVRRLISLPMHNKINDSEINFIVDKLKAFFVNA